MMTTEKKSALHCAKGISGNFEILCRMHQHDDSYR